MKVIFLDFDGVLNSQDFIEKNQAKIRGWNGGSFLRRHMEEVDPEAVARIKKIVDATGCKIVISSSWRILHDIHELRMILERRGLGDYEVVEDLVIDITPRHYKKNGEDRSYAKRGDEVIAWLSAHKEVTKFVCIDDDSDFYPGQNLVHTGWKEGIQDEHVDYAIELLNS